MELINQTIAFFNENSTAILAVVVAIDTALSFIPSVKASSLYQVFHFWVVSKKK